MIPPLLGVFDQVAEAFRKGGGVAQSEYDTNWWGCRSRVPVVWVTMPLTDTAGQSRR